jgi:two-component system, NarL family, nitrate/nitrite response regulator NarL
MSAAEGREPARGRDASRGDAPVRVLLVDDHDLFRTRLASLLRSQPEIDLVGQASRGNAGVRLAEELKPDVVLIDLRVGDISGHEATRMILERRPSVRVIALSVLPQHDDVIGALQAGASGYLLKDAALEELVGAIRAAAEGAAWLSPRAAEILLGRLRRAGGRAPEQRPPEDLSPRELDVLRLIAQGMDNTEIAAALNISPRTAKNHVSSILAKLGLPNRVQAATYAVRRGLD